MSANLIVVESDGSIRLIYSDALAGLQALGRATTRRASHVEPTNDGRWTADMGPSGGPVLGPFQLRAEALYAEVGWLERSMTGGEVIATD